MALRVRPESSQDHAEISGNRNSISISNGNTVTLHKHRDIGAVDVSHQYTFDKVSFECIFFFYDAYFLIII